MLYDGIYADEGCSHKGTLISKSCQKCPLSECKYDNVLPVMEFVRRGKVVQPCVPPGMTKTEWVRGHAAEIGVSEKTLWRRLAN